MSLSGQTSYSPAPEISVRWPTNTKNLRRFAAKKTGLDALLSLKVKGLSSEDEKKVALFYLLSSGLCCLTSWLRAWRWRLLSLSGLAYHGTWEGTIQILLLNLLKRILLSLFSRYLLTRGWERESNRLNHKHIIFFIYKKEDQITNVFRSCDIKLHGTAIILVES